MHAVAATPRRRIPDAALPAPDDKTPVNDLFVLMGIQNWKPVLTALLLPPVPWLLVMLAGARLTYWRRSIAWLTLMIGAAGIWLCSCSAVGEWLERSVLKSPPALATERIAEVKKAVGSGRKVAIVALGGGREALAPEYGLSHLNPVSLHRLHYAIWLSRQTGAPVLFSGGVGLAESVGVPEAEAAARIAERDYGRPLTWVESESRDTRENATRSLSMLNTAGVTDIVIVTHGWHMRRAVRAFEYEAQRAGMSVRVTAAPMGLATSSDRSPLQWLPTTEGITRVRWVLRELGGLVMGA